jgi:alpha-ribazole phosphatase
MRLYLVRHPKPLISPGVCYGRTDLAVAADEDARVASILAAQLPADARLISSPLQRCAGLATALGCAFGSDARFDARLVEMDFGRWEGWAWSDIPRAETSAWSTNIVAYRPGGGESLIEMAERVSAFHAELRSAQQDSIIVCHAGTIRLLQACERDLSFAEMARYAALIPHKIGFGEMIAMHY